MGTPAGRPSTVTPSAGPWDSPAVRNRNTVPPGTVTPRGRRRHVGRVARFYGRAPVGQPLCVPPGLVWPPVGAVAPLAGVVAVPVAPPVTAVAVGPAKIR